MLLEEVHGALLRLLRALHVVVIAGRVRERVAGIVLGERLVHGVRGVELLFE